MLVPECICTADRIGIVADTECASARAFVRQISIDRCFVHIKNICHYVFFSLLKLTLKREFFLEIDFIKTDAYNNVD